jgi:hypothetical protein
VAPRGAKCGTWTKDAIYEVFSNGSVIFSAPLDQTTASAISEPEPPL